MVVKADVMGSDTPRFFASRYRIESKLGEGGSGEVYKAWDTNLQKPVVIKSLFYASGSEQERDALKNVKSKYLPQVTDFLVESGRAYTVMEFVEGQSLDKVIRQGERFSRKQVVKWYGQLVSALVELHSCHICHRDIKPGNIMLLPNDDVCLIDFNAALVEGNDVQLISRSLGYCSPEQYEIYERYVRGEFSRESAPVRYKHDQMESQTEAAATVVQGDAETELSGAEGSTDMSRKTSPQMDAVRRVDNTAIDWQRSDIYSLGATMYHLLSGVRPPKDPAKVVPIGKLGDFGEGITYVIAHSMENDPAKRFSSAADLLYALQNLHKYDSRWKALHVKMLVASIFFPVMFALFAGTAMYGKSVIAQEKEERYYNTVYGIENSDDPQDFYEQAINMYENRIDPYWAMAQRLWADGEVECCREYIESNLGNLAKFSGMPEAAEKYGDICYLLGNCSYYQQGEPDYAAAAACYENAVQYVKDNPLYYRDYAIALARVGEMARAERILEKAQVLKLDRDSLDLTKGELGYMRQDYDQAEEYLTDVIARTGDDYILYRACHTMDEIYKLSGCPQASVELLSGCLDRFPLFAISEMTERLADAYIKSKDYEHAILLLEQLAENGTPQFHILQDLAILLQEQGAYERASAVLDNLEDLFPNDYRISMQRTYLEIERQSKRSNQERDYSLAEQYFVEAEECYAVWGKVGEPDPKMLQLEQIMEELKKNHWIK